MASPICTVNATSTTDGVNVSAGVTFTIALADAAGVKQWSILCVSTDDLSDKATINATAVVDQITKTATFNFPAGSEGYAAIFQSKVNNGVDINGRRDPSLTTTFGVYVLTGLGYRVAAFDETLEGSAMFGWITKLNNAIRNATADGSATAGAGMVFNSGAYDIVSGDTNIVVTADSILLNEALTIVTEVTCPLFSTGGDVTGTLTSAESFTTSSSKALLVKTGQNLTVNGGTGSLILSSGVTAATGTGTSGGVGIASGQSSANSGFATVNSGPSLNGNSGLAQIGSGSAVSGTSGQAKLFSGTGITSGVVTVETGVAETSGNLIIRTGTGSIGISGTININSGLCPGNSGQINIGTGTSAAGNSGQAGLSSGPAFANAGICALTGGSSTGSGRGGSIQITSGGSVGGSQVGGDIRLILGLGAGGYGNINLGSNSLDFGSGKRVVLIPECGTAPTAASADGTLLVATAGGFAIRSNNGNVALGRSNPSLVNFGSANGAVLIGTASVLPSTNSAVGTLMYSGTSGFGVAPPSGNIAINQITVTALNSTTTFGNGVGTMFISTLLAPSAAPTAVNPSGLLYVKNVGGKTQLFWRGFGMVGEWQITNGA